MKSTIVDNHQENKEITLWRELLAGNVGSFEQLIDRTYELLFRYGNKFSRDRELVKDCIQDIFLEVWEKRNSLNHNIPPRAYLLASLRRRLHRVTQQNRLQPAVIDNKDRFGYALEADFQTLFKAPQANNLKEHIFDVDFLGLQSGAGGANDDIMPAMTGVRGADAPKSGWSVIVPSLKVYSTWDARDYRKKVSFDDSAMVAGKLVPYTEFSNTKRPHIAKYARFAGNSNSEGRYSDQNYSAMRYAEILLIAAEASVEVNGPTAEATGYINEIRARARNWAGQQTTFPANVATGLNKADMIDLIMEERRLELAFEFKRWYDIKRRNLGEKVFLGPDAMEPQPNFNPARDYLMPLPRIELQVNPNLGPQNPGY